jgi:hypothetical protein
MIHSDVNSSLRKAIPIETILYHLRTYISLLPWHFRHKILDITHRIKNIPYKNTHEYTFHLSYLLHACKFKLEVTAYFSFQMTSHIKPNRIQGDLISLLLLFQNKKIMLKIKVFLLPVYLFICSLFAKVVNKWEYTALNNWILNNVLETHAVA